MTPGTVDLRVQRWVPFLDHIDFEGLDFSGGTFALQVRLYRDAPGAPLLSLTGQDSSAEGLSVNPFTVGGVVTSRLQIRINETTIEALLPFAVTAGAPNRKAGSDVTLAYDLVITGGGLPKTRWIQGEFTIEAGVTQ